MVSILDEGDRPHPALANLDIGEIKPIVDHDEPPKPKVEPERHAVENLRLDGSWRLGC